MPRPTNALIIDDESHVRSFIRLLLREVGITSCWEASDGASGVEMALKHKPELVMLDINLPQMNGMEVLAKLHDLDPDIPVVMMTSQSAMSTVTEAVRLGAVGYLLKHSPKEKTLEALTDIVEGMADDEEEESAE